MASSSSNPDLSKNLNTLSLSGQIDPWSHPIDDNDPEVLPVPANLPAIASNGDNTDNTPPRPDSPPPLPAEAPPLASSVSKVQVDQTVLNGFDPLSNKVEQEAKMAWEQPDLHPPAVPPKSSPVQPESVTQDKPILSPASTHSHPPPAPIPVPDPVPIPPTQTITDKPLPDPNSTTSTAQDLVQSISRSTTPSLSGISAIARTFIPKSPVRTPRPLSIDQATVISSPTTATFGISVREQTSSQRSSQSQGPALSPLNPETQSKHDESRPQTPGSAPRTPKSATKDVDKDQPPPFDFQFFLEQMKSKSTEPVAKYLRSFLANFAKRPFPINDQVKLIHDFLNFIAQKMQECEVWKNATEVEFDNALEGMEKLVMNRLYDYTFTPQIPHLIPPRSVTTDDLERDRVLAQRIALFGWIEEKHLDVPEEDGSKGFLMFAQQELLKVNHYKAPRDKLICILNCCKVIFGPKYLLLCLLRHLHREEGADAFLPILIFVVLKANPSHLLSNVEFINRFRNPTKLQSEAGYYLSSLMGAVSFIETMDHTALSNITQEEFEENVEFVLSSLPEDVSSNRPTTQSLLAATTPSRPIISRVGTPISTFHVGEESAVPLMGGTSGSPPTSTSPFATLQYQLSQLGGAGGPGQQNGLTPQTLGEDAKRLLQKTGDAVSKPLNALGRIFSEALDNAEDQLRFLPFGGDGGQYPSQGQDQYGQTYGQYGQQYETPLHQIGGQIQTPYKPRVKRTNSSMTPPPGGGNGGGPSQGDQQQQGQGRQSWHGSPTRAYTYSNRPLIMSPGDTPGRSPSPAPSKLQSLLGFGFGDGHQSQSQTQSSTVFDSPTPANRPAPRQQHGRSTSTNYSDSSNDYGGGFRPPSDSYTSLVQAQESYLQSQLAQADTPDMQLLQAEIDRAHQKQSEASKGTLRQIFPGVDEEVLEWVLEGSEGQLERSIEMLLEITSGG
ncbi:hypothetical protein BDM02DRAFT_3189385 [Thelephora ganbajun]|uniref:Uncharacterized protein n=1 Tax=Thelephora ganbajun TaxID=370292 RepID=A0ACB6Z7W5_THEGA|nr:hypothetical protein BDM02DRAFT_3189385 [Thelephora ganbajun]